MIVKVQRPVMTNGDGNDVLVYAEGRQQLSVVDRQGLPPWLRAKLTTDPKLFAEADYSTADGWTFHKLAPWQAW